MALVLGHVWRLLMLAVDLGAGIMSSAAAAVAAALQQLVTTLTSTAGLSDLTLRDVCVLGLAIILTDPSGSGWRGHG